MIIIQTFVALLAFAGNSLLSRMALMDNSIDPSSFAALRLLSGALTLVALALGSKQWVHVKTLLATCHLQQAGQWRHTMVATISLTVYMFGFAYAYQWLPAGIGALVLFGSVQVTMLLWGLFQGERLPMLGWLGGLLCMAGVTFLSVLGDVDIDRQMWWLGALLMIAAGVAWGVFSLAGRLIVQAMAATAVSFILASLIALVLWVLSAPHYYSAKGILCAVLSGSVTSGLGYFIWYRVLPFLSAIHASVVQLATPVLVGLIGIVLLNESLTSVFWLGSLLVLGGLAFVLFTKRE